MKAQEAIELFKKIAARVPEHMIVEDLIHILQAKLVLRALALKERYPQLDFWATYNRQLLTAIHHLLNLDLDRFPLLAEIDLELRRRKRANSA